MAQEVLSADLQLIPHKDETVENTEEETFGHLPRQKDHPFHRNHPLELVSNPPPNYRGQCICDFCMDTCAGLAYQCSACDVTLDLKCATSPKFADGSFPELQHFVHEQHPLLSIETHVGEAANVACIACLERLQGPIHSCVECRLHFHSKCLHLHRKISHPSHRKHPLLLLAPSFGRPWRRVCDVCGNLCRGLVYNCRFCDFDIHITCVSPPPELKGDIHHHSFSLLLRRCEFVCDGCGGEGDNVSAYLCSECNLVVHKNCVFLPSTLKLERHRHPLHHTFFIPKAESVLIRDPGELLPAPQWHSFLLPEKDLQKIPPKVVLREDRALPPVLQPIDVEQVGDDHPFVQRFSSPKEDLETVAYYCELCRKELNSSRGCYYCSECNYAAHVDCAIRNHAVHEHCNKDPGKNHGEAQEEDQDHKQLVESTSSGQANSAEESLKRITVMFKEYEVREGIIRPKVIKHFDHGSDLILCHEISSKETQCYACLLPMADSSYFSCPGGDYFIHEDCAVLAQKLKHWSHHHELSLAWKGVFVCDTCLHKCCASSYRCGCGFSICIPCSKIPQKFEFWGHEHPMVNIDPKYEGDCSTCGNPCGRTNIEDLRSRAFKCEEECEFVVDCRCLILPRIARHPYDEHLLTLTFREEKDSSPVCDICQASRDPKHWFYSCEDCDFRSHIRCVLGDYPYIRIGDPFTTPGHQHGVRTFKADDHPACTVCNKYIVYTDLALKCTEPDCPHIIHFECTCTCDRCHCYFDHLHSEGAEEEQS